MSDLTNIYRLMSRLRRVTDNGDEQADIRQKCSVSYVTCIVDESWIERIEQGMNFVGKAIDEERRFIRVNGEVQPIEKVRKVSKESVQHLARHSDLITHEQQQDIVPDKLYTVERLNDYATYENRFLYRLLVTTRDFIATRYAGIVRATGEYVGKLNAEARLSLPKHTVQFTLTLNDERRDDLGRNAELIERLEKLTRSVRFYLDTPLMTDIAKEAAVNAVITKNNVLKMDRNFKEAVDLYEYLMGYKGDGYEICEKHSDIDITRDINMLSDLTSYALYVRGLGLEEQLERETDASDRLGVEQIRKRSAEEYLLALEERSDRLNAAEARITEMQRDAAELSEQCDTLNAERQALIDKLTAERERTERTVEEYTSRLADTERRLEEDVRALRDSLDRLEENNLRLKAQVAALSGSSDSSFDELEMQYEALGRLLETEWKGVKRQLRRQANSELKRQLFGKSENNGDK